jgi:hypothetical protein
VPATWEEIPGLNDVLQFYSKLNKELPQTLYRVDRETEMSALNLGEPLRFITSIRLYMNPLDGRAIAYDMAQTSGGQPQRMVGHVSPRGVTIEVYHGGQLADRQDIDLARDTFMPINFDFVHLWYEQDRNAESKRKKEPIRFSIFVPEAMAQVMLVVKPLDDQTIPIGDANYACAHYEVVTFSTQSAEGLSAKQEMWFDRISSRLMKRQDFDAALNQEDAPVTEREPYQNVQQLARMTPLPIDAPEIPEHGLEFLLDQELYYTINAREADIGHLTMRYGRCDKSGQAELPFVPSCAATPEFYARAEVDINTDESSRHETAVTLYDAHWQPLAYETRGAEAAGLKLTYDIHAKFEGGWLTVNSQREAVVEMKRGGLAVCALAGVEAGRRDASSNDETWHDPLRRVPLDDEDARAAEEPEPPRLIDQSWSRRFPAHSFVSDFNRVEHLQVLARRLPLPTPIPPEEIDKKGAPTDSVKAGLFLVRQNRAGVVLFETRQEIKPKLTERQKHRLTAEDLNEPQLFVATSSAALLPTHMLLSPDGRILQLKVKQGAGDIVYTLDDPIMKRRQERARVQKLQEGPRLLRPPWW